MDRSPGTAPAFTPVPKSKPREELLMLHYALIFFVVALVAAVLGFRGVAGLSQISATRCWSSP
jgi:hypothetical protein